MYPNISGPLYELVSAFGTCDPDLAFSLGNPALHPAFRTAEVCMCLLLLLPAFLLLSFLWIFSERTEEGEESLILCSSLGDIHAHHSPGSNSDQDDGNSRDKIACRFMCDYRGSSCRDKCRSSEKNR